MKPHLSILLAIFGGVFLYSLGSCSSGGVTLAYCKNINSKLTHVITSTTLTLFFKLYFYSFFFLDWKWRRVLSEMLTEIPFHVNSVRSAVACKSRYIVGA